MSEAESLLNPVAAPDINAAAAPVVTEQQEEPESKPERTFTQQELDEAIEKRLARERRKLERIERQREIEEAERRGRESATRQTQQPANDGPPKREDFDSLEDYIEARADWKVESKLAETRRKEAEEATQRDHRKRIDDTERTWAERVEKAQDAYPDFEDVVVNNRDLVISDAMAIAIKSTEHGIDLAYQLGKNPDEAARIAKLDPVAQVFELGRLAASTAKPAERPVSKAAPPVEPVRGQSRSEQSIYDADEMTTEQWIKMRNKQIGR